MLSGWQLREGEVMWAKGVKNNTHEQNCFRDQILFMVYVKQTAYQD
jgi:hypothetical protein